LSQFLFCKAQWSGGPNHQLLGGIGAAYVGPIYMLMSFKTCCLSIFFIRWSVNLVIWSKQGLKQLKMQLKRILLRTRKTTCPLVKFKQPLTKIQHL